MKRPFLLRDWECISCSDTTHQGAGRVEGTPHTYLATLPTPAIE